MTNQSRISKTPKSSEVELFITHRCTIALTDRLLGKLHDVPMLPTSRLSAFYPTGSLRKVIIPRRTNLYGSLRLNSSKYVVSSLVYTDTEAAVVDLKPTKFT